MHPLRSFLNAALGLDAGPNLWQMGLRALVVYLMSILLIRGGSDKRMLGRPAPFDIILAVIFGSVMSRAINGSAPFFQTIGAGAVFILAHWGLALLGYRYRPMEVLLKGKATKLEEVALARLECNGEISVIPRKPG